MRTYILIPILLLSVNSFAQTETTVTYGDSVYRVRYVNNYALDSAIRWNYFTTQINDSTFISDSSSYMFKFRRILSTTKDSVLLPTRLKTVNSTPLIGNGDITVSGGSAAWGSITGTLSSQTDLQTALNGKQNTLTLTTTGSGAATLIGATLNIPTPAGGGGSGYTTVVLPSDVTNSTTTIADVTGLSFPVTSGITYKFKFYIIYTSAATTTGSRWSINGPATTLLQYTSRYNLSATAQTTNFQAAYNVPAAANASSLTAGNCAIIEGVITPSANGTVIARFASEIAASAIVAKAKSYVEYQAQ